MPTQKKVTNKTNAEKKTAEKKAVKARKNIIKKGKPAERGIVLQPKEFLEIISGKRKTIKRPIAFIPVYWKSWIEQHKQMPKHIASMYAPGNLLFMMEGFRPELKPNGDIHRYMEDKDTFVPPPSDKYRKLRFHSAFSMKKSDSRLWLRIVKFSLDKTFENYIWKVEIDMERSKPQYWPVTESKKTAKTTKKSSKSKKK